MVAMAELKNMALQRLRQRYPSVPAYALPSIKYTDKTSNGLTKAIIDWIELNGYQAERINSTGRQLDNRQTVKDVLGNERTIGSVKWIKGSSTVGTADVHATIKSKSVKIEVKCKATNDNYQSDGQRDYQRKIEQAGGVYIIARTFEGFYNWYCKFLNEN